ncbi:MAG: response regulator [Thermoanaerobaculia bacterium]
MTRDERANILVVDDSAEKLMAFGVILGDLAQNIVTARSGREALRHLLTQEFAVILLDVNMPGMDGFETAGLIRQRRSSEQTPIIFVTAFSDDTHAAQGYSLGAVDYIITPVIPEILKSKVSVFVELFRKTAQISRQAESLQLRASQLHRLTELSLSINSALSFEQILQIVADSARELVNASSVVLFAQVDPAPAPVRQALSAADTGELERAHAMEEARLFAELLPGPKPLRVSRASLAGDARWEALRQVAASSGSLAGRLSVPLSGRDGREMGWMHLVEGAAREFTHDDETIIVQLAQIAAIALENTLYSEAREANRLKDEFLTTLSHELRTPLTAILGWTRLLRMDPKDAGRFEHGLDVIERNVSAQAKLIEDLLDVSRIAAGKLRLNVGAVSLVPTVTAAVDSMRPTAEFKGIQLGLTIARDVPESEVLAGDTDRLQQVVWNLLANAIKFTPSGGRVDVNVSRDDSCFLIELQDSGQGISPTFLAHVFDRFRQADSSTTRSHGGLGIGLALVRHIVELHGGDVSAQSPGLNQGSTFRVRLPIIVPPALAEGLTAAVEEPVIAADLTGCRILLVDDERDAREVVFETLRQAGAQVECAASMHEALAQLDVSLPDVLISDIAMPGGDGFELIRTIRASTVAGRAGLQAIAVTAYARQEDRVRALSEGFQRYLTKPVEPTHLIRMVAELANEALAPKKPAPSGAAGRQILLIEDDADSRESLRALLELQGHRVEEAWTGPQGIEKANAVRPDVAVIDIGLPGMDGNEVARQLRSVGDRSIFLIALTGYSQQKEKKLAIAAGFDAHLIKPLNFDELNRIIEGV